MTNVFLLDDEHHLVRHIRQSEIDEQNGTLMAFPQAFELRPGKTYLSNGGLEFWDGATDNCLCGVATAMSNTRAVKAGHGLAIGNVGSIREAFESFNMKVRVLHEPQDDNLSYATVRRVKTDDDRLLELLAQDAWNDVRRAKPFVEAVGPWRKR